MSWKRVDHGRETICSMIWQLLTMINISGRRQFFLSNLVRAVSADLGMLENLLPQYALVL